MKNTINYHNKIIQDINKTIYHLVEQSDKERQSDVTSIRSDIIDLRDLLFKKNNSTDIGFSKIRIKFFNEYELKLPKYGVESFDRTLKGEMYFNVLGSGDGFIDIRTSSFPNSFRIRLFYNTLEEYKAQKGEGYLIYRRGTQYMEGDETKLLFKIIKKS
jgi:hypothetical protein